MPKIGMRMIKSAAAVFLCFMIDMLRGGGIPFYSAIAAILCMQRELSDSMTKGRNRMIATLIGGIAGMGMLYFIRFLSINADTWPHYLLVSAALIPLIYTTVLLKQPDCTYLSCVVFLCICISHGSDENPMLFAMNRILDTWIGILVALLVNALHFPHRIYNDTWLEIPLSYLTNNQRLSNYMQHHLNRFSKEGMKLFIISPQTPAQLNQCISPTILSNSFLLLDGAMCYNRKEDRCIAQCEMSYPLWVKLYQALSVLGIHPFLYEISDYRLYIHHQRTMNQEEALFYQQGLLNHENHFVLHDTALHESYRQSCIMLKLLIKKEMKEEVIKELKPFIDEITWIMYENGDTIDLRIYPIQLSDELIQLQGIKDNQLKRLRYKQKPTEKQVIHDMKQIFYHHKIKK